MISIQPKTENKLREVLGDDLDLIAEQAVIAEAYRTGKLSIGQVSKLLDCSIDEAYGFMKARGISVQYSLADLDADLESLRQSRNNA